MMPENTSYYRPEELTDFPKIGEDAPELADSFFEYYSKATSEGALSKREKSLIALAVASVKQCPYCIDAYTNTCLSLGLTEKEMMEAIHVGAAMSAGIVLAHSTQMRRIAKKKRM